MTDLLSVYNEALGVAGARGKLSSVADRSREREVCDLFYPSARKRAFAMAYWPSLTSAARLNKVAERNPAVDWADGDPLPPWRFAYALPADHSRSRFLEARSPFTFGRRGAELVLLTNEEKAILTYTSLIESPASWEDALYQVVVAELALTITPSLSLSDSSAQRTNLYYMKTVSSALVQQANAGHQFMPMADPLSRSTFFTNPTDIPATVRNYMGAA